MKKNSLTHLSEEARRAHLEGFGEWLDSNRPLSPRSRTSYLSLAKCLMKGKVLNEKSIMTFLSAHRNPAVYSTIKHFLTYLGHKELASSLVRPRYSKPKRRILPPIEEFHKVIKALPEEEKFISLFLLNTGLRAHEVFTIRRGDLIQPKIGVRTKAGGYRVVELTNDFYEELRNYVRRKDTLPAEPIFYTHSKATLDNKVRMYHRKLYDTANKVISKKLQTHDFRRLIGSLAYQKTRDIYHVKMLLGHSDIRNTERYILMDQEGEVQETLKAIAQVLTPPKEKTLPKPKRLLVEELPFFPL